MVEGRDNQLVKDQAQKLSDKIMHFEKQFNPRQSQQH
jgi:hypothetical protein